MEKSDKIGLGMAYLGTVLILIGMYIDFEYNLILGYIAAAQVGSILLLVISFNNIIFKRRNSKIKLWEN